MLTGTGIALAMRACHRRLHVTRHIRFAVLAAIVTALLVPADLFAGQRSRANPRSSGQGSSTASRPPGSPRAVPRPPSSYRPYYNNRYYSPRYYYPGYYGYRGFYGYPGFYPGFYSPYFWGGYGFGYGYGFGFGYGYGYGYGQYPYPPYYYGRYYDTGSARLQVTPRNAQVYIDGYFVGVVDNFDGSLQRLNVEAGEHELQLYLEGYRPFTQKVLFPRGGTLKIVHAMQPLGAGESAGAPPKPDESLRARPADSTAVERQAPPSRAGRPSEFGSLLLRVRPSDADILVDGEVWNAPEGEDQFVIELGEGPHRIEVRKDGFQTYSTTVRVRRGESVRLNVSLTSGGLARGF
jgi:hypothetical protein